MSSAVSNWYQAEGYDREALTLAGELGMRPLVPTATSTWASSFGRPTGRSRFESI
jgi:hypothetical protein